MRVVADFAMQGRWRAVGAVVALGALGVFIPPIAILSGAVVALVALRLGLSQAVFVAGIGALILGALVFVMMGASPVLGVTGGIAQWLPVAALAEVLRRSVSWSVTLSAAAAVAGLLILMARAFVPDLEQAWIGVGMQMLAPFVEDAELGAADLEAALAAIAPVLTGLLAGILMLSMILSVVIARYWQALLYNPGAFGPEFRSLQMGRTLSIAVVVLALAGQFLNLPIALELAFILGVLFFLQGLAVMHGLTHAQNMSSFWLVGMYVLLVLALPQMFLLIVALGVIDGTVRLRERWATDSKSPPD